jgi:hypothetical protein
MPAAPLRFSPSGKPKGEEQEKMNFVSGSLMRLPTF